MARKKLTAMDRARAANAMLEHDLAEVKTQYYDLNQAFDKQARALRDAHVKLTEHGISHVHNDLSVRIDELAMGGGHALRAAKAERDEKVDLLEKKLAQQRELTKTGHQEYEKIVKVRDEIKRLLEMYETTIQTLSTLLVKKPKVQEYRLAIDWIAAGKGTVDEKGKSVHIPVELVGGRSWELQAGKE